MLAIDKHFCGGQFPPYIRWIFNRRDIVVMPAAPVKAWFGSGRPARSWAIFSAKAMILGLPTAREKRISFIKLFTLPPI